MNKNKQEIINKLKKHEKDTGSSKIQIAILSNKIKKLSKHFQINKKDNHSKRGLLKIISNRRKLIKYLKRINFNEYKTLILKLNMRK